MNVPKIMYVLTVKADSLQVSQCNPVCLFFSLEADGAELRADLIVSPVCVLLCFLPCWGECGFCSTLWKPEMVAHLCVRVCVRARVCVSTITSRGVRVWMHQTNKIKSVAKITSNWLDKTWTLLPLFFGGKVKYLSNNWGREQPTFSHLLFKMKWPGNVSISCCSRWKLSAYLWFFFWLAPVQNSRIRDITWLLRTARRSAGAVNSMTFPFNENFNNKFVFYEINV